MITKFFLYQKFYITLFFFSFNYFKRFTWNYTFFWCSFVIYFKRYLLIYFHRMLRIFTYIINNSLCFKKRLFLLLLYLIFINKRLNIWMMLFKLPCWKLYSPSLPFNKILRIMSTSFSFCNNFLHSIHSTKVTINNCLSIMLKIKNNIIIVK